MLLRREELSRLTARVIRDVRPLPVPQRVGIIEQLVGGDVHVAAALLPMLQKILREAVRTLDRALGS